MGLRETTVNCGDTCNWGRREREGGREDGREGRGKGRERGGGEEGGSVCETTCNHAKETNSKSRHLPCRAG